jgi:subtilisin family serine protease
MKVRLAYVSAFVLLVTFAWAPTVSAEEAAGRYLVMFKGNSVPKDAPEIVEAAGGTIARTIPEVGVVVALSNDEGFVKAISKAKGVQQAGEAPFEALPETPIVNVEEDGPTGNDWAYNLGLQWGINRVHAPEAWADGHSGSHDTVIAVIDTGVAWNHPDLAPNVVFAACITHSPGCNPYPSLDWHGTHVAGIVAAAFDGGAVVGVGPGLGLASYNTFEEIPGCGVCTYTDSRWIAMIDAADRGFDVINMSLGGYGFFGSGKGTSDLAYVRAMEQRVASYVNKLGTTVVATAGNGGISLNGPVIHLPGDVPGIINVGATGIGPDPWFPQDGYYDFLAGYSNYGAPVTVTAPGGDVPPESLYYWEHMILSTYVFLDPACAATYSCPGWYAWTGGTSMAAPHVSGVAGLIKDIDPGLNPNQVESIIKRTADQVGSRQLFGHGIVDAFAAVMVAD